jgi:5-formyltetrahydrofolate cyclo-ligase
MNSDSTSDSRPERPEIPDAKKNLRQEMRSVLAALTESRRVEAAKCALALLRQQETWRTARCVLFYAPIRNELDIWPALVIAVQEGKLVCLPRFDNSTQRYVACRVENPQEDLQEGRYGIREPRPGCELVALNRLDFALVPGVAFDLHGRRLGQGRGYYDRLLADISGNTCGVAYDEQVVRAVPVQPHDSDVNCILTPTRWIEL